MTKLSIKKFKNALPGSYGVQAVIAKACGVDRSTITLFLQNHPELKILCQQEREKIIDVAENRLFAAANNGSKWAIDKIISTIGKERGYVERQETEQVGAIPDQKMELHIVEKPEDLKKPDQVENSMEEGDKILIVDIETTNFLQRGGLIVEIGIVELNLLTGKVEVVYNELVKEEGLSLDHAESWIFKNSDLKLEDCMNAKPLDLKKISELLAEKPVTAYNTEFDFGFLRNRGVKICEIPCLMKLSKDVCKIPNKNKEGIKMPNFQEAWNKIIGEEYIESHRGVDDAVHEARVAFELYKKGVLKC